MHPHWETECRSSCPQIPHLFWNPKVFYFFHINTPFEIMKSRPHLKSYLFKIQFIILASIPRSPKWPIPSSFSDYKLVYICYLFYRRYISGPSDPFRFYLSKIFNAEYKSRSFSSCNLVLIWTFSLEFCSQTHEVNVRLWGFAALTIILTWQLTHSELSAGFRLRETWWRLYSCVAKLMNWLH